MICLPDNFESFQNTKLSGFFRIKRIKEKRKKAVGIFCSYTPGKSIMAAGACLVSLCGSEEAGLPCLHLNRDTFYIIFFGKISELFSCLYETEKSL